MKVASLINLYCSNRLSPIIKCKSTESQLIDKFNNYINPNYKNPHINTGLVGEFAVKELIHNVLGLKHINKAFDNITPDFYNPSLPFIIEVKTKRFFSHGALSERLDNIPRKYNPCFLKFKKPVLVVLCAGQIVDKNGSAILAAANALRESQEYNQPIGNIEFINYSKAAGVKDWVSFNKLEDYIMDHT